MGMKQKKNQNGRLKDTKINNYVPSILSFKKENSTDWFSTY